MSWIGCLASFTGEGAFDQGAVTACIGFRRPRATIIVSPHYTAVRSGAAETAPTQRDRYLPMAEHGRMALQAASGDMRRARAEPAMSRFKQVIGDGLRSHMDEGRANEVAVCVLNRMLEFGRPNSVRIA